MHRDASNSPARARAVCAWSALACGIWLGSVAAASGSVVWFSAACVLGLAAMFLRGWACRGALAAGLVCLGAGWGTLRLEESPAGSVTRLVTEQETAARVAGVVLTFPVRIDRPAGALGAVRPDEPGWRFDLLVRRWGDDARIGPVRGVLTVFARERTEVKAGDRVAITGAVRAIPPALNPGESDRGRWARSRGLDGTIDVPRASLVEVDTSYAGIVARAESAWHAFRGALRARAESALGRATAGLSEQGRVLVFSLLLGRAPAGGAEAAGQLRDSFTRLGLAHVLAISGFHLVVLVAVLLRLLRAAGDPGRLEPIGVAALVLLYLMLVPASAPIVRAGVLALALVLAEGLGRRYDRLTLLTWVAVGLLAWRPAELWSLGYQLSCGLTALLVWLGERVHARIFRPPIRTGTLEDLRWLDPSWGRRLLNAGRALFSTTLLCWLVSSPLILWRTGLLTPLAIPAALVVVPLSVLVLAIGFVSLLVGLAAPGLAAVASAPLGWCASACVWAVERLDAIPGAAVYLPPVSMAWVVAATALSGWWLGWARGRGWRAMALAGVLAVWAGAEWRWVWRPGGDVALRVDTLAVGDGSSYLIRSAGESLLWDCGSPSPSAGRVVIRRALRALGETRVRTLVLTHPDVDHYSALPDLAGPLGVRRVFVSARFVEQAAERPGGPAARALSILRERGVDVVVLAAGDRIALGGVVFEVLSPPIGAAWEADNEHSLVARVGAEGRALLMTGDVQGAAINSLRERGLSADVVEAPHHGSAIPAAVEWVTAMSPTVVLQSSGPRRLDDARWAPSRERSAWLVTARDGAAWVEIRRGGGMEWGAWRGPR